jgi:hypothetical protein
LRANAPQTHRAPREKFHLDQGVRTFAAMSSAADIMPALVAATNTATTAYTELISRFMETLSPGSTFRKIE